MTLAVQISTLAILLILVAYVIRQLQQIHNLVNSRLSEALTEIKRLGGQEEKF